MSNGNFIAKKQQHESNSYTSDDFEDASASGSAGKTKIVHWPGKDRFNQQKADSVS
jgi:hypothetical protein